MTTYGNQALLSLLSPLAYRSARQDLVLHGWMRTGSWSPPKRCECLEAGRHYDDIRQPSLSLLSLVSGGLPAQQWLGFLVPERGLAAQAAETHTIIVCKPLVCARTPTTGAGTG